VAAAITYGRRNRMGFVMNEWTKQRDLLIEETLAFVQGVAVNTSRIPSVQQAVEPKEPATSVQKPVIAKDLEPKDKIEMERTVIQRRVANFKAHQERFEREREEYFTTTMAKARATQWIAPKP
jgi:hypothetical protein